MKYKDRWLTKKQAAEKCGLSTKTLERAISRGKLRRANIGFRRVLIAYSDLRRFMKGEQLQGM